MARKPLSTRIENDLQKEIKKLAIDLERPLNDLLEEAIQDLLKKYEKKSKKWRTYILPRITVHHVAKNMTLKHYAPPVI